MNWIALTVEEHLVAQEGLGLVVGRCLGRNSCHESAFPKNETRRSIRRVLELAPGRPFGIGTTLLMPDTSDNAEVSLE